jgi:UDP-N-acetylmuramate dehydrogenase
MTKHKKILTKYKTKYNNFINKAGLNNLKLSEPLSKHTTIGIGGPADLFYEAVSVADLVKAVNSARKNNIACFILGGGSNILATDKGFRGLVIKNKSRSIKKKGSLIYSDAGAATQKLVNFTIKAGLQGLQHFSGFYGTVGGAVYNNAHFKKHFIFDNLLKVKVLNKLGKQVWFKKKDIKHGYDYTSFHNSNNIILQVLFKLKKGRKKELEKEAEAVTALRKRKHPVLEKSAGCFFQNPKIRPAGKLIEDAGLKGKRIGGAEVSRKHAAFIVNKGGASFKDVLKLTALIKKQVKDKFDISLQKEVFIVGEK